MTFELADTPSLRSANRPEARLETMLLVGSWAEFAIVSISARSASTLMAALLLTPIKLLNQGRLYFR